MNTKQLAFVLDNNCEGRMKRIYELYKTLNSLIAFHQDSWSKLFKTKHYKKALETRIKVRDHLINYLIKEFPEIHQYNIEFLGSTKLLDVQYKRRQRYVLIIKLKDLT